VLFALATVSTASLISAWTAWVAVVAFPWDLALAYFLLAVSLNVSAIQVIKN
jgi:hypothetical protein